MPTNGSNSTLLNLKSQLKHLQKLKHGKLMNKNFMKHKPQTGIRFNFYNLLELTNKKLLTDSKSTSARN